MWYPRVNEPESWPKSCPAIFNSALPTSPTRKATSSFSFETTFSQGTRPKATMSHTFSGRLMLNGKTLRRKSPKELWEQTLIRSTAVYWKHKVDNLSNKEIQNDLKRNELQSQLSNSQLRLSVSNEDEINSLINQQSSINQTEIKPKMISLYRRNTI